MSFNFIRYTPKFLTDEEKYTCVDTHSDNYVGKYNSLSDCQNACDRLNKEYEEFFLRRYRENKKDYKEGMKIRIIEMKGEPNYAGREGVIEHIDDMKQLHGNWGGLAVQPENDVIEVIE